MLKSMFVFLVPVSVHNQPERIRNDNVKAFQNCLFCEWVNPTTLRAIPKEYASPAKVYIQSIQVDLLTCYS